MTRSHHSSGQCRWLCGRLPLVATLAAVLAGALAAFAVPAAGAAAVETARLMEAVRPDEVGPGALVNTLGLRATRKEQAGKYVTVARDYRTGKEYRRLQARVANQLFTEFGVFRDVQGRFKLLGADGRWVSIRRNVKNRTYEVGTWANKWAPAWSFKLKRPAEIPDSVISELTAAGIDSRQVLCVLAYSPLGAARGSLAVSGAGVMLLESAATCGEDTAGLFITDSLKRGMAPGALVKGVHIDPITYVRFVPPDNPASRLTDDQRRLMRNEVLDYFDMLINYNKDLANNIVTVVGLTADANLGTSYTLTPQKARDINLAEFFVNQASYALSLIPAYGPAATGVLKATYDTVELGIALAHNRNLEGPRVVQSITNTVLTTKIALTNEYRTVYSHFQQNLEDMRDSILEGCTDPTTCTSDRRLFAWQQADPMKNVTDGVKILTRDTEVARHELAIWRRMLPLRGVLFANDYTTQFPRKQHDRYCSPGYPLNSAYRNEEVLFTYESVTSFWPPPLVTTAVYYPYYTWYDCWTGKDVHMAYMQEWNIGLADGDAPADPVTPLDADTQEKRLFTPWNPADPINSGFGLSRIEVACKWLSKGAHGYMGRAGYYFNPCHFAFYDVTGAVVSPYQWEDGHYDDAAPYSVAFWIPDPDEVAAGRQITDPDVLSPLVPDLDFGSCAAFQAGDTKTVPGGAATKVYFTNLHDGAIDVYRIRTGGSTTLLFTLPRQDQLARPLPNTSKGPLPLTYSRLVNTTAGTSFLVRRHGDNACIGTWTAGKLPVGAPVDYAVAEVHGSDGILH